MSEQKEMLVPQDVYLKSGIHIGTKFKTKAMEKFIYKTRPDGLSVLNLQRIDERLRVAVKFISQFEEKDIMIVCRRENGWKAVKYFAKMTGIDAFTKKYPPGVLTNIQLEGFSEKKLLIVCDEWADRNPIKEALKVGVPIIALCDTNNNANRIDLVIPCNNKGQKSLGLVFYVIAREYLKIKGKIKDESEMEIKLDDFIAED